jgi:hypothetical protein
MQQVGEKLDYLLSPPHKRVRFEELAPAHKRVRFEELDTRIKDE